MCQRRSFPHRIYFLWLCAFGKTLKLLALFLEGHVNKDLDTSLVALVIFKCFVAAALWGQLRSAAMKCCLWPVIKVELIAVQSWLRAMPGHTQQAHTREFYMQCQPRGLIYTSCRAVWEDGSHFSASRKKKKPVPNETQIPATHLQNQTHSPSPSSRQAKPPTLLSSNSHFSFYLPQLHSFAFPLPVARVMGLRS